MMNGRSILKELNFMFTEAIEKAYPDVPGIRKPVQLSNGKHGDYKCISTMQICQVNYYTGIFMYVELVCWPGTRDLDPLR